MIVLKTRTRVRACVTPHVAREAHQRTKKGGDFERVYTRLVDLNSRTQCACGVLFFDIYFMRAHKHTYMPS